MSGKKQILLTALILVLVLGAAEGAYWLLTRKVQAQPEVPAESAETAQALSPASDFTVYDRTGNPSGWRTWRGSR